MEETLKVRIDPRALSLAYDQEADVLYISFGPDREADDAVLTDEDIIIRYRRGEVVGLTVLHFSKRIQAAKLPSQSGQQGKMP